MEWLRTLLSGLPLVPMLLSFAGGGIGAGVAAWNVRDWIFETIDRPAIVKATQDAAATIYEASAKAAQSAALLAKFKAIEALTEQFYRDKATDDAQRQARLDELQQENADYEQQMRARGRSYAFDQSDVDYLNGVRAQPGGAHH